MFKFVWTIYNFDFLPIPCGKSVKSPVFNVSTLGTTFLEFYPNGDVLDPCGKYAIICLNKTSVPPSTKIKCSCTLLKNGNDSSFEPDNFLSSTTWRFCTDKGEIKNGEYIGGVNIEKWKEKNYLEITCTFLIQIAFCRRLDDEKDLLALSFDLEHILLSQNFADITLVAGTKEFPAHRAILKARLPQLLVEHEESVNKIVLNMDPHTLEVLLCYLYTGQLSTKRNEKSPNFISIESDLKKLTCQSYEARTILPISDEPFMTFLDIPLGLYTVADTYNMINLKQKLYCYSDTVTATTKVKLDYKVFSWHMQNIQDLEIGKKLYTPTFIGGLLSNSGLKVSCGAVIKEKEKSYEIHVKRLFGDESNPILVRCKFSVGEIHHSADHLFVADDDWLFPSFFNILEDVCLPVQSTCSGVRISDAVSLKCEIYISGNEISEVQETECVVRNSRDNQVHFRNLSQDLSQLYNIFLPKVSDVTLQIEEVRFPAHKVILAARSPVFERMFNSNMSEANSGIVSIIDIDVAVLNMLLMYMYSGNVELLTYDSTSQLYAASDKYEMMSLKEKCAAWLKNNLTIENACDVLVLADMHADVKLKKFTQNFMCRHADEILGKDDFQGLIERRSSLAAEILKPLSTIILSHRKECLKCQKMCSDKSDADMKDDKCSGILSKIHTSIFQKNVPQYKDWK